MILFPQKMASVNKTLFLYYKTVLTKNEQNVNESKPFASFLLLLTLLYLALIYGRHTFRETGSRESEAARTGEPKGENLPSEGQEEEVVVAVMGVTGSGKSTFIRTMTEKDHVHVGHGLESGMLIPLLVKAIILCVAI